MSFNSIRHCFGRYSIRTFLRDKRILLAVGDVDTITTGNQKLIEGIVKRNEYHTSSDVETTEDERRWKYTIRSNSDTSPDYNQCDINQQSGDKKRYSIPRARSACGLSQPSLFKPTWPLYLRYQKIPLLINRYQRRGALQKHTINTRAVEVSQSCTE